VLVALLYAATVILYALGGDVQSVAGRGEAPPSGGVTVVLTPQAVNAAAQTIDMDMSIRLSPELTGAGSISPDRKIDVVVSPTSGAQSITFAKDEVPSTTPIVVITAGEIESWPFDSYRTPDLVVAACTANCATAAKPLPTRVYFDGHVPGWSLLAHVGGDGHQIDLSARRAVSTIAFGIVLLALMVAMPCLVLFVGISTLVGRRKVEPSFMSWMAAMLFATIPLRTFLPGSPPIGSWIDFTIVLWVIVGLVTGLVIYATAWSRESSRARGGTRAP
jgi:hypothetical protein